MAEIESLRVNAEEPFHAGDEVGLGRFEDDVKVVSHQAIGMNLPAGFEAGLGKSGEKNLWIGLIHKNILALIAAAENMVEGAWKFASELAWHGQRVPLRESQCQ